MEAVEAYQVGCTVATYEGSTYLYQPETDMWFIFEKTLGWVYPTEEELPSIEILDYLMFNDGEQIH